MILQMWIYHCHFQLQKNYVVKILLITVILLQNDYLLQRLNLIKGWFLKVYDYSLLEVGESEEEEELGGGRTEEFRLEKKCDFKKISTFYIFYVFATWDSH